jgi:hypothetical protein
LTANGPPAFAVGAALTAVMATDTVPVKAPETVPAEPPPPPEGGLTTCTSPQRMLSVPWSIRTVPLL